MCTKCPYGRSVLSSTWPRRSHAATNVFNVSDLPACCGAPPLLPAAACCWLLPPSPPLSPCQLLCLCTCWHQWVVNSTLQHAMRRLMLPAGSPALHPCCPSISRALPLTRPLPPPPPLSALQTTRSLPHITSSGITEVHVDAALAELGAPVAFPPLPRVIATRPATLAGAWAVHQQAASCTAVPTAPGLSTDAEDVAPRMPAAPSAAPPPPPTSRLPAARALLLPSWPAAPWPTPPPPIPPSSPQPMCRPAAPPSSMPPPPRLAVPAAPAPSPTSPPARCRSRRPRRLGPSTAWPCCSPASAADLQRHMPLLLTCLLPCAAVPSSAVPPLALPIVCCQPHVCCHNSSHVSLY